MMTTKILAALMIAGAMSLAACSSDGATSGDEQNATEQLADNQIKGKVGGILKDILFLSEGDFPYVVLEGDAVTEPELNEKLVREKLRGAIQAATERDILPASCLARPLDVNETIAAGDVPSEDPDDKHDKQLSIALKTMRGQLRSVQGFTFGENESGDQDDVGPVVFVYVGISKTTGKLIAIMTQAVFT